MRAEDFAPDPGAWHESAGNFPAGIYHAPDPFWHNMQDGSRGISLRPGPGPQYRRPRTRLGRAIRRLLGQWWVWCVVIVVGAVGTLVAMPPSAAADEQVITFSAPAVKYVTEHGVEVCATLDTSTPAQVGELLHKMRWLGGLTGQQADEALYFSVISICPIHLALLDAYIDTTQQQVVIA